MTTRQTPDAVREALPPIAPGHWDTEAGRDMAIQTLSDTHIEHNRKRISDFALANEVFLSPGIANLTDAKERIRWLSASLAVALAALDSRAGDAGEAISALRALLVIAGTPITERQEAIFRRANAIAFPAATAAPAVDAVPAGEVAKFLASAFYDDPVSDEHMAYCREVAADLAALSHGEGRE